MNTDMIYQALTFMMLGMSIVFFFLIILVYILKFQAYTINKFVSDDDVATTISSPSSKTIQESKDHNIIAAITGAILHHNNRRI
ncbi:MAG: sodium pump decarboxylase subunit gamma [Epsilonproteobacteria bacterium]|nr:MAG: sodium pump decarboxylase subunit gamma [Campylobacterota bacterium]